MLGFLQCGRHFVGLVAWFLCVSLAQTTKLHSFFVKRSWGFCYQATLFIMCCGCNPLSASCSWRTGRTRQTSVGSNFSEPPLMRRLGKCLSAVFQYRWPLSALKTKLNSPPVRISLLQDRSGSNPVTEWIRVMRWVSGLQISPSDSSSAWRFLRAEMRRC